jgi:hypothetical protein
MKMPLAVSPVWMKKYNLDKHAHNGYVYLYMVGAVLGLPQVGIFANKPSKNGSRPTGILNASTPLACGSTNGIPFHSPLSWMTFKHANHLVEGVDYMYIAQNRINTNCILFSMCFACP